MKHALAQNLERLRLRHAARIEDLHATRCTLTDAVVNSLDDRPVIRNCSFESCSVEDILAAGIHFQDVHVQDLDTGRGALILYGCSFERVTLAGRIGRLIVNRIAVSDPLHPNPLLDAKIADQNDAIHSGVDWALDIRDADLADATFRDIPASKFLLDPSCQFAITRSAAMQGAWRKADLSGTHWPTAIENFLRSGRNDTVFAAPRKGSKSKRLIEGLRILRDLGLGEPAAS